MVDILIAIGIGVLTIVIAYLGVHVTFHPADSAEKKSAYKVAFALCGLAACGLIAVQAYRNLKSQEALNAQLGRIETNTKTPPTVQVNVPASPPTQVILQPTQTAKPKLEGFAEPYIELLEQKIEPGVGIRMNVGVVAAGIPIKDLYFAPYPAILTDADEKDFPKNERGFHEAARKLIQKQRKVIIDQKVVGMHVSPGVERPFVQAESPPPTAEQLDGFATDHTRLYVIMWAMWKDENGVSGETEVCRRLQAPQSNVLNAKTAVWLACMQ
jgi:hypothetical protein